MEVIKMGIIEAILGIIGGIVGLIVGLIGTVIALVVGGIGCLLGLVILALVVAPIALVLWIIF
jgi:hypothetical protein